MIEIAIHVHVHVDIRTYMYMYAQIPMVLVGGISQDIWYRANTRTLYTLNAYSKYSHCSNMYMYMQTATGELQRYIHTCIYMYICMYMYIYTQQPVGFQFNVRVHTTIATIQLTSRESLHYILQLYTYVHVRMYNYTCTCTYIYLTAHVLCIYIHTYIHTCTYAYIYTMCEKML